MAKTTSHTIMWKNLDESIAAVATLSASPPIANSTVQTHLGNQVFDMSPAAQPANEDGHEHMVF